GSALVRPDDAPFAESGRPSRAEHREPSACRSFSSRMCEWRTEQIELEHGAYTRSTGAAGSPAASSSAGPTAFVAALRRGRAHRRGHRARPPILGSSAVSVGPLKLVRATAGTG